MAKTGDTRTFLGGGPLVAQIDTVTPASPGAADEFWVRLENKGGEAHTVTVTADGSPTVAEIVTALQAAAAAAKVAVTAPWDEVTTTDDTTHLTITADNAGVPFICTAGTDGVGNNVQATTIATSGPGIWSLPENWKDETIPVAGDDVEVSIDVTGLIYGEDWDAVAINSLTVTSQVPIGSDAHPLQLGFGDDAVVNWWGTGLANLDFDNVIAFNVFRCGATTRLESYDLSLRGTEITRINWWATSGRMSVALGPGQVAEVNEIVGHGAGVIRVADGVTEVDGSSPIQLIQVDKSCRVVCDADADILKSAGQAGGVIDYRGGATVTVEAIKGTINYAGTGGITGNLKTGGLGTIDFGGSTAPITVTDAEAAAGAQIRDPQGRVTWTDGIELTHCSAHQITLETAAGVVLTPAPL